MATVLSDWDDRLVRGFRFACRPGCALCCYAQPRVDPDELSSLRAAHEIPVLRDRADVLHVRSYPDGGACRLLSEDRCIAHLVRPLVCSSFPVEPYAGRRSWQPSVVLSCPGLSLAPLDDWAQGVVPSEPASGLDLELRSARRRALRPRAVAVPVTAAAERRRWEARLRRRGQWVDYDVLRTTIAAGVAKIDDVELPGEEPPDLSDGRELLPIFYDGRSGPVSLAAHPLGWSLDKLSPRGGVARSLGVFPIPTEVPEIDDSAARRLAGYLVYWLHRDQLIDEALLAASTDAQSRPLETWVRSELAWIRATVLSRAVVRAHAVGEYTRILDRAAIDRGIMASDADLLDRGGPGAIP